MAKTTNSIVTIGLSAFALPAAAQDYYAGASFGFGDYVVDDGGSSDETSNPQSLDVFGGARFDVGAKMFVGVEVQATLADGYLPNNFSGGQELTTFQGEVHFGYTMEFGQLYGFVGIGQADFSTLDDPDIEVTEASETSHVGVGAEVPVADSLAIRVEAELTKLSIDDNCCGVFDVSQKELSVGAIYSF